MKSTGFHFPVDDTEQWDGFNDPGMEHFAGDPFINLGRETTQNSMDAPISPSDPVRVRFSKVMVPVSEIPDVEGLAEAIDLCSKGAADEGVKAQAFFTDAIALLEKKRIAVLKVEDFHTKGLTGPCENGTPFYAMLKASGQSKKDNSQAGGSFGIGKFAPFVLSKLRTVFVSTVWYDEGKKKYLHYVQGKSRLMSFKDDDGKTHKATGFWGKVDRCQPVIEKPEKIPEWLRRAPNTAELQACRGTTIFVLGFPDKAQWRELLAATIAENFFGAIQEGKLAVEIDDEYVVDAQTLPDILLDAKIAAAVESDLDEGTERFTNARLYHEALACEEKIIEQKEQKDLGHIELTLLVRDGLPKKVAFLRNGMLITESLTGLIRFNDLKDFIAVVRCKSAKGNKLLREMEPPRHDTFEPARITNERTQKQARAALKEVSAWVKEMLARHARDPVSDKTTIDELAEFFADESTEGNEKQRKETDPFGAIKISARKLPMSKIAENVVVEEPAGDGALEGRGGDQFDEGNSDGSQHFGQDPSDEENGQQEGGGDGVDGVAGSKGTPRENGGDIEEPGAGGEQAGSGGGDKNDADANQQASGAQSQGAGKKGDKPSKRKSSMVLRDVRAVTISPTSRRMAFTPSDSGRISLTVFAAGADSDRILQIVETSSGAVSGDRIEGLNVKRDERVTLTVELGEHFNGAVRVVANAV